MRIAGLYAGIGGFELGFQGAGGTTVLLADKDDYCRAVLKARFTEATVVGDVAEIHDLPSSLDIVTAGFPCQNLSMAGDKTGLHGSKTGDVMSMFELLGRHRIGTLVLENVYFLLNVDQGRAMSRLVSLVESLGYAWAYRVVDLRSFGIPQRRRRVIFVASSEFDPATVLFQDDDGCAPEAALSLKAALGFYWTEGRSGVGLVADAIPPLKAGSTLGIPSPPAVLFSDGRVMVPSLKACERLQGFPVSWTDVDFSAGRSPRWRMLGNAMPVPIAEWVAKCLTTSQPASPSRESGDLRAHKWPGAAFGRSGTKRAVSVSEYPVAAQATSIEAYLDDDWRHLSRRALDGFIRRAEASTLRFPDGFLNSLRRARAHAS
ncbi:DNA cytosine methyltransferase [Roseitalea porphyridii]|jgi:DNA (cytosine-5)-methyltransferase 1